MKIKPSELTGAALDWAVARCAGVIFVLDLSLPRFPLLTLSEDGQDDYTPSTDWAQGGPIIEREKITLSDANEAWAAGYKGTLSYFAPTPLIAAMRCYVASKLGDEVDVPDELV